MGNERGRGAGNCPRCEGVDCLSMGIVSRLFLDGVRDARGLQVAFDFTISRVGRASDACESTGAESPLKRGALMANHGEEVSLYVF
jgi:hypothetical protein